MLLSSHSIKVDFGFSLIANVKIDNLRFIKFNRQSVKNIDVLLCS